MSSSATHNDRQRGQQTLFDSLIAKYPDPQAILRLEPSGKFIDMLEVDPSIEHVMVTLSQAERVLENYGGFDAILQPHHDLTIIGCEQDEVVTDRGRWDEFDLYADIERQARIVPDWLWVYDSMDPEKQLENVSSYLSRFEWLYEKAEEMGLPHDFMPLAKGVDRPHFEEARETFDRLGINRFGMYAVQTPSHYEFCDRVREAIGAHAPEGVLVIGRGSPRQIEMLPERVDEVASFRYWKDMCNLTKDGYSQELLAMWMYKTKRALTTERTDEQAQFQDFTTESEVAING